jgi:hypothetical protein
MIGAVTYLSEECMQHGRLMRGCERARSLLLCGWLGRKWVALSALLARLSGILGA